MRSILALAAITTGVARAHLANTNPSSRAIFDSDSFDILVDGGATASISNNIADFLKPPRASKVLVKGFNGSTSATQVGTVSWPVLDDEGRHRSLKIPNTYYVPSCPIRLLSPQHYSQETNDHRGTYSTNFGDHVLFIWNKGRYRATLPLSSSNNVGVLRSAPGNKVFSNFLGASSSTSHFAASVITDDEADQLESDHDSDDDTLSGDTTSLEGVDEGVDSNPDDTPDSPMQRPNLIPFDLDHDNPRTNLPNQDDATSKLDAPSKLMRWHCRLGHLPFANI
jgi:hypothetical protein